MKYPAYLTLIFISCFFYSCNNEDLNESENEIVADIPENTITTPCNFDLSKLTANKTIVIDCLLDLGGKTVVIPENVVLEFGKGDIVNGTLDFSKTGKIDGRLLSSKLQLKGDVKLITQEFKLYAVRWDIIEGKTTSDIALKNNAELERLLFYTKELGANTFIIDKLDAYFEVTKVTSTTTNANYYPSLESVNIPSDYHLKMSDNTHLRLFPADQYNRTGGAILAVRDVENVTVSGGNLYGDRDERVFSSDDDGQEGCHLFLIHSGRNITVDNINFENGSSGTFAIFSFGFAFKPDYNPTKKVTIKNCTLKNSRRMAIALVDGHDITIENNTFINAGQPSANTDGGEVGYAINIEPVRYRNDQGELIEQQKVTNVLIRGNKETGSRGGFLTLTIGQDITVEDNDIETRVVYSLVNGVKIQNNNFNATGEAVDSWALFAAGTGETVFNNEITNNTFSGYSLGMVIGSNDANVHHNTITNCGAGIQISKAFDAKINNNTIDVSGNGIQATNTHTNNTVVKENTITSGSNFHVYFAQLNNKPEHKDYTIILDNNEFTNDKQVVLSNSSGITFKNNSLTGGIQVGNASNINVSSNTIKPNESDGIRLHDAHTTVSILNNTITEPSGAERFECINNSSTTPNAVTITENICNE